jgi:hypothetical protein
MKAFRIDIDMNVIDKNAAAVLLNVTEDCLVNNVESSVIDEGQDDQRYDTQLS